MRFQSLVWVIDDEHFELLELDSTRLVRVKVAHNRLQVSALN